MSVIDSFDRVQAAVEPLVEAVKPAQFGDPTPCTEWDVRALMNHLVHVIIRYAAIANGLPPPDEADHVGGDPATAFRESGRTAREAFLRPGMLEQPYDAPWGKIPGSMMVQHVVNELLAHGWDLARATGQSTDITPDLAAESLAIWREWSAHIPRSPGSPFGPEQPAPNGATAADRLAAFLGRKV